VVGVVGDVAVVPVVSVFELVDVAVKHRGRSREPREVGAVGARDLALRAGWFGSEGEKGVDREWCAGGARNLPPARELGAGILLGNPSFQSCVAVGWVRKVIEREYLGSIGLAQDEIAYERVGGKAQAAPLACLYEGAKIAAVVMPGVLSVVVGDRRVRVERLGDC
jgi:hypothetical protein